MIEVKHLTKRFGSKVAVDDLSFTVENGEILGFLGPNGAGKSTTMNIITGCLGATDGSVSVNGYDVLDEPYKAKRSVGYLPEQPPLYLDMTVDEYLGFVYELKKVKFNKKAHLDDIKNTVAIADVSKRRIKNLSKGYRQRVGLAQALIGNPAVLVLDEPTVGLDPAQIIEIRTVIKELAKRHTIILSSHILPEVSAVCNRVLIINKGRIVAEDTPENLSRTVEGENSVTAVIDGDSDAIISAVRSVEGVTGVELANTRADGGEYLIKAAGDVRREISVAAANAGGTIIEMRTNELSLEDIFIKLTGASGEVKADESHIQA